LRGKTLKAFSRNNAFIVNLSPGGSVRWASRVGGSEATTFATSLSVDKAGNCIHTGYYTGNIQIDNRKVKGSQSDDIYFVKFSPEGNMTWVHTYASDLADQSTGISLNDAGHIAFTGRTVTSVETRELFVSKLAEDGSTIFQKKMAAERMV
jgi:hypothetical protein